MAEWSGLVDFGLGERQVRAFDLDNGACQSVAGRRTSDEEVSVHTGEENTDVADRLEE